jgi:hypothetical protein
MGMGEVKDRARRGPKTRYIDAHARQRFALRFGIEWTPELRKQLVWMIQTGRSTFLEKQSNARSLHRVTVGDQEIVVVYDKIRATVVTALYPEGEWPNLLQSSADALDSSDQG